MVSAFYTPTVASNFKVPVFLGCTVPVGSGGGDTPDLADRAAMAAGVYARSALDNSLFAVNYQTVTAGAGLAYLFRGLTMQVEATVFQLTRVRGETVDKDAGKTNLTAGIHLGYAVTPWLVASGELRGQRWLSTPASVLANPASREQFTGGLGLRSRVTLGRVTLRPGAAFFVPLDDPMQKQGYRIVQVDVPVTF
jgi:hypothetical protein